MARLLVDAPSGEQQLVEVGEGGGYFDSSCVVWDERTDGALPEITLGGMVREEHTLVFSPERKAGHDAALPPSAPQIVTRRQAKVALLLAGKLSLVQPAIDAIADPTQRGLMQIEWDEAAEFDRHRPSVIQMAQAIGLTDADIDQLFITAATLS
jgi:hypothetical protein